MKVLILSCSTGEGHNSASKAYMEYLHSIGVEAEVKDTMSLVGQSATNKASEIYLFSTRTKLFGMVYKAGAAISEAMDSSKSPVYYANKLYCERLHDYIEENGFTAVVCAHIFPAEAISGVKRKGKRNATSIFLMTDYTCIPFIKETELDYYIVPHSHLIEECVKKGIPREKLRPYGIPVKSIFHNPKADRTEVRNQCILEFGYMDPQKKWFLMMSGSMGFGHLQDTVKEILKQFGDRVEVIMVCGNNTELRTKLMKNFGGHSNVMALGFTDKVAMLMDACDVLFTKPGGLSSTEAAAKHIPIVHTSPIPGCETCNALFFHYHGMSYATTDIPEQVRAAGRLCFDESCRDAMISAQAANINTQTCRDITGLLLDGENNENQ